MGPLCKSAALPANVRLRRKLGTVANTLAYYNTEFIMAVKSFITVGPVTSVAKLIFLINDGEKSWCVPISCSSQV
jgi:hypothetical protein